MNSPTRDLATVADEAVGALEAQHLVDRLRGGEPHAGVAWLLFVQLAGRHGWRSVACRAYVEQLAKLASE